MTAGTLDLGDAQILFQKQVPVLFKTVGPTGLPSANSATTYPSGHPSHSVSSHHGSVQRRQWVTVTVSLTSKSSMIQTTATTSSGPMNGNGSLSALGNSATSHLKVLRFTLTDEQDPFFLYQLDIGEDDFHQLRAEQNLLVDFADFPIKFVELLEECIHAVPPSVPQSAPQTTHPNHAGGLSSVNMKEDYLRKQISTPGPEDRWPLMGGGSDIASHSYGSPKFIAQLQNTNGQSIFTIVETNTFKHITHISLHFVPGNDVAIKNYLASLVHQFKDAAAHFKAQLQQTEDAMRTDVQSLTAENQHLKQTIESLRFETAERENQLKLHHADELNKERERLGHEKSSVARDLESAQTALTSRYEQQITQLSTQLTELQSQHTLVTTRCTHVEEQLASTRRALDLATSDADRCRKELSSMQSEKSDVLNARYESEKSLESFKKKCEGLERSLDDKNAVIQRLEDLLASQSNQGGKMEENMNLYKRQQFQLEQQLQAANGENMKANEIISKLQSELKTNKSKLKLKNVVTMQQEKLLDEKQHSVEMAQKEVADLKEIMVKKESDLEMLSQQRTTLEVQLSECKKTIEDNTNVIEWLHKQLNEEALAKRPLSHNRGIFSDYSSRVEYKRGSASTLPSPLSHGTENQTPASQQPLNLSKYSTLANTNTSRPNLATGQTPPLSNQSRQSLSSYSSSFASGTNRQPLRPLSMQSTPDPSVQQSMSSMSLRQENPANKDPPQLKSNYF